MGKFNKKLGKKNKPQGLEIVPKAQEQEVQLAETRKSDDVIPRKVKIENFKNPRELSEEK
jgi:hypothetical protein